ncbi:4-galactosyl-N-acetylglucosaminide 3-alpha-L-fucosyltransferase FUT5-like [Watersipora subatra]|uniref:4-galactosyl-N-acetylglucosaminide 3-alpha-L-fucosyltransferase FUT5-like n=1 Tax=Watersipora subatra TaxID=2589382 RepID=UPI00355C0FFE
MVNSGKYQCRYDRGSRDISSADMVLFSELEVTLHKKPPTKPHKQLWAFFSKEPQIKLNRNQQALWNGHFNYNAIFDRTTEGSFHIFRSKLKKLQPARNLHFTPKPNMRSPRILWFVSHCSSNDSIRHIFSAREEYVLELSNYIPIDIFTTSKRCVRLFGNLTKTSAQLEEPPMSDYMFYLSFENSLCKDYITEKFWKVLESNSTTIPIALGGTSIKEYEEVAPPSSFLHESRKGSADDGEKGSIDKKSIETQEAEGREREAPKAEERASADRGIRLSRQKEPQQVLEKKRER